MIAIIESFSNRLNEYKQALKSTFKFIGIPISLFFKSQRMTRTIRPYSYYFILCLTGTFLTSLLSIAQTPGLNNVVSPSPTAAAMAEYVVSPPNLNTGIPSINIPVTRISSKKLSWPITLSYHGSGIKVGEEAGWVGLGWSLQGASAVVTRAMRGLPDEAYNGYFEHASSVPDETASIDQFLKQELASGYADMIPDLFYYNTGMSGGKIIFGNDLTPRKFPHNDAKISVNTQTMAEFIITEPDGTIYQFTDAETTTTSVLGPDPPAFKSTWYLTRIISADQSDTIQFNYTTYADQYITNQQARLFYYYNVPAGASKYNHQVETQTNVSQSIISNSKLLSSIVFYGGKVEFQSSTRSDGSGRKLDTIIEYYKDPFTGSYVEKKRTNFHYSYFGAGVTARLKLDDIQEQSSGEYLPPHQFEYLSDGLPATTSVKQDHWGYYNGTATGLIPAEQVGGTVLSTSNREVNATYVKGNMLKKIISPLEGETEFVFESNVYLEGGVNKLGPGTRIQKIIKRDPFSNIEAISNYDYTRPEDGLSSGKLLVTPQYKTWMEVEDNNGGTTYNYNCLMMSASPTDIGNYTANPIGYAYATVYQGDSESVAGKTVSKFSTHSPPLTGYPYVPTDDSWSTGMLLEQEHYKVVGSTETIVSKLVNDYTFHSQTWEVKGLKAAYEKVIVDPSPVPFSTDFVLDNYFAYSKFQYLAESRQYTYEENSGTIASERIKTYHYDTELDHTFPVKLMTQTSDTNVIIQQEVTYPKDYSTGVFVEMNAMNMIATPVESKTFSIQGTNEYLIGYSKTEFLDWGNNDIYPQYTYRPKIATPVLRSTFNSNPSNYLQKAMNIVKYSDNGLPIETKRENGQSNSTLIDPYHNSAIASCSLASAEQLAYTGFETPYRGLWTVNQGSSQQTGNVALSINSPSSAFEIHANQTINYSYSVTRTAGPSPTLTFSKIGGTAIEHTLSLTSGSGNAALTPGLWTATISWGDNVSAMSVSFSYLYTHWNSLNISSTAKTGLQSLSLQTGNTISKTELPAGDYVVSYYQKNGTVSFSVSGSASVLSTETNSVEPDGWSLIRKTVRIINTTDAIQLTSSSCLIDELRLQPVESFMTTLSYDRQGRMVTKTDQNIRSQYYEFDVWGRVVLIRDNERNIRQHYEYKFASN